LLFFSDKNENGDNWYSAIIGTFPVQLFMGKKSKKPKPKQVASTVINILVLIIIHRFVFLKFKFYNSSLWNIKISNFDQ